MANITKTLKDARGYERTGLSRFHELSPGERPTLGVAAKVASYLPVKLHDQYYDEWFVILAGTIVSLDSAYSSDPVLVPAIGAAAQAPTYTADDIGYTVDLDSTDILNDPALVAAAGSSSNTLAANIPIGWAWYNWYSGSIEKRLTNYKLQPDVSILCDYEIEIPLIGNSAQTFAAGSLVKPGVDGAEFGVPQIWVSGVDSVELVCGRVLYKAAIPSGTASRDRADLQRSVRGLGLTGMDNNGVPRHLDSYLIGSTTVKASYYVRINIALL